jgi:tripartite-type tricarboxylate transporter receptor subunit TctC
MCRKKLGRRPLGKRGALRQTSSNKVYDRRSMCAAQGRTELVTRILVLLAAVAAVLGLGAPAAAEDYPTRPVRIIIPLGAGGGGDVFTRLMAEQLQKRLGQPFVVENRPGGGLNIGTRACAEAQPDGYTICVLSSEPVVYNKFAFKSLPFDAEKDLEPIANLFINSNALVINSSLNVKTIPQLIALAKAKPKTLSYGTFSFVLVYFMDKLNKQHGLDIVRVPFRSGNEMMNAVVAGTTQIAFLGLSNMLGQIRAGQITGLALNSTKRSPLFPEIPTLKEATGEDYPPPWFGLFAPAGTPKSIIDKIHDTVASIISEPEFVQKNFTNRAIEPAVGSREEFIKFIAANRVIAARIAKESGLQPK